MAVRGESVVELEDVCCAEHGSDSKDNGGAAEMIEAARTGGVGVV